MEDWLKMSSARTEAFSDYPTAAGSTYPKHLSSLMSAPESQLEASDVEACGVVVLASQSLF